jgi:hypothetical protein
VQVTITSKAVVVGQPRQVTVNCTVATAASRDLVNADTGGRRK